MPQTLIVIFLLFFAVLAYAWFYWQRAKGRAATSASVEPAEPSDAPPSA
jgi:cbb3-type cytochrome oxidase subunit 3